MTNPSVTPRTPRVPRQRIIAADAERTPEHVADRAPEHDQVHEPEHEIARAAPRTRTRMRRVSAMDDPFYIPVEEIPEGSSYEWKRFSNVGQEDPFYIAQMRRQGWEPVDPKRHPTWVPPGYNLPTIVKGGMILMERPIELTQEAQRETRQLAQQQMAEAEQRLGKTPNNTLTRDHAEVKPRIEKQYMRPVPIED